MVGLRGVGRRPHAGGHGGARRLRPYLPRDGRPDRGGAPDLGRVGGLGRRRRLLARADRPDPDDRGRRDVPDRPGGRARGARRGDLRRRARRSAGARAQRRLPPRRARRAQCGGARARAARVLAGSGRSTRSRWWSPSFAELSDPGAVVPSEPRRVYDVRDALPWVVDAGSLFSSCARAGRATWSPSWLGSKAVQ